MAWPSIIYVATTEGGIYRTDDFVDPLTQPTWTAINGGLATIDCKDFDLDPFNEDGRQYVLIYTGRTLYRRVGTANWTVIMTPAQAKTLVGLGGSAETISSFCTDASVDGRLWVLFKVQIGYIPRCFVLRSDDYGDTWLDYEIPDLGVLDIISYIRANGDNIYVTMSNRTDQVYYSSHGGGGPWTNVVTNTGFEVCFNQLTPTKIYVRGGADDLRVVDQTLGMSTLIADIHPIRTDSMWFDYTDPDHQRMFHETTMYTTADEWTNSSDNGPVDDLAHAFAPWAGADVDQMFVAIEVANTGHIIGCLYGEADTTPNRIGGANAGTPPYTDSIPYIASNDVCGGGIKAVGRYRTVGHIHTYAVAMPGYVGDDRGVPMEGDRGAWDALNYPLRHTDDIDVGIHWTAAGLATMPLGNHDHSGDAGDGGTFDAANLTSGASDDGDVLTSDGLGGVAWEPSAAGALILDDLLDVNAPAPNDDDVLMWDDVAGEWIASPCGGDMLKSVYDTDNDGSVELADEADTLDGHHWADLPPTEANIAPAWFIEGALALDTSVGAGVVIAQALTIDKIWAYAEESGASSSTIIDIHLNGVTIFTTQANRPTIAWNDADHIVNATPDILSLAAGDLLTLDIDQVAPGASSLTVVVETFAGAGSSVSGGGWVYACGRMTLTSGNPIPIADVSAAATLYFTPYKGNKIGLFDGVATWRIYTFSEISLALGALNDATAYDIFAYDNAGTVTLEALAWTNPTTRATALVYQDGILVKSGATTRRYLGTIYTSGAGICEDSGYRRFVWNYYNQVARAMSVVEATNSWTYDTATWRAANNNTGNRVEFVLGMAEIPVAARVLCRMAIGAGDTFAAAVGIGLDVTNANSAILVMDIGTIGGVSATGIAEYYTYPAIGYHYLQWVEYVRSVTALKSVTFYGDGGIADLQSGMIASIMG